MSRTVLALLVIVALLAGCDDQDQPYVKFEGGGFMFNYRIAEAFYGFSLRPMRKLPAGPVLEAEFEDPSGGPAFHERQTVGEPKLRYLFRTPALKGIRANVPYRAKILVRQAGTGSLLATYERTFTSDADQSELPEIPLVPGPAYQRNPDLAGCKDPAVGMGCG